MCPSYVCPSYGDISKRNTPTFCRDMKVSVLDRCPSYGMSVLRWLNMALIRMVLNWGKDHVHLSDCYLACPFHFIYEGLV